jgi:hypothetical protein
MPRAHDGGGVSVTSRVLGILESFDAEHRALTLSGDRGAGGANTANGAPAGR